MLRVLGSVVLAVASVVTTVSLAKSEGRKEGSGCRGKLQ
jgi:hypothetical protein